MSFQLPPISDYTITINPLFTAKLADSSIKKSASLNLDVHAYLEPVVMTTNRRDSKELKKKWSEKAPDLNGNLENSLKDYPVNNSCKNDGLDSTSSSVSDCYKGKMMSSNKINEDVEKDQIIQPVLNFIFDSSDESHFILEKLSSFFRVDSESLKICIKEIDKKFIEAKFNDDKYKTVFLDWPNKSRDYFFKVNKEKISAVEDAQAIQNKVLEKITEIIKLQGSIGWLGNFLSLSKKYSRRASLETKHRSIKQDEMTQNTLEITSEGMRLIAIILKALVYKNKQLKYNLDFDTLANKIEGGWEFIWSVIALPQVEKLIIRKHPLSEINAKKLEEIFMKRRENENSRFSIGICAHNSQHLISLLENHLSDLILEKLFIL